MKPGVSGDALKHLRHDLRTPLNHILGYTEILIEDGEADGTPSLVALLREVHAGGRRLMESIQTGLADTTGVVEFDRLAELEAKIRPEAERLLALCRQITEDLRATGPSTAIEDADRVSSAFERLLALLGKMMDHGAPQPEPAVESEQEPVATPGNGRTPSREGAGRMLVVDDNSANRALLRRRLEKEGHGVTEAENGVRALQQLQASEYDLMLLDVMMPEMDGYEVLARIKDDPRFQNLPVIMISALDEIESAIRCIEMGAEEYLPKPFDPVLLKARIGSLLEKKRLRDREREKTRELEQALQRLKETQDQLIVQEKMASLGVLTAGIAHEIKNPLNFVVNFSDLSVDLLKELAELLTPLRPSITPDDASYMDGIVADLTANLQRIRDHGKRADSIVRGMLSHSRGSAGQAETVDLNALLSEATNLAYHGLRARDAAFNIAIENDFEANLPAVQVVAQDLSRVFLNIVNNACYAAHQKKLQLGEGFRPTLRISTRKVAGSVDIRIRDNGTGVPKSVVAKIFNPFFTTKPTGSGTGLGLSLSYQIVVEQHKGSIKVNTEEGEYTEFVIALPV